MKQQIAAETTQLKDGDESWAKEVIHGNYFPHIDGLRSLAVLPVVFYHLAMNSCPGGFMGVDVFFAISGYLICGAIVRDLEAGSFSMRSFYFRRIRRIFPAYFVVVLTVLIAGVSLYHWARIIPLAQTTLFSSFFSANLYFWLDMGYFQPTAHGNPLLHLWSLGVEEQFYIIIPIALLVLWKVQRKYLGLAMFLCFSASLGLCVFLGEAGESTTAFYLLATRGWELLAGALLAMLPRAGESRMAHFHSLIGLLLLAFAYSCVSASGTFGEAGTNVELILPFYGSLGTTPFPGWVTLPAIAGSLLLLRYGNCGPVGRLLCCRPLVGIGKISYSLYLWHWPIIVFAGYITYDLYRSFGFECVLLVISFLAAYLSWRWVEMPVRVSHRFTPRRAFLVVGVGCSALAGVAIWLISTDGLHDTLHRRANLRASPPLPFMKNFEKFVRRPDFQPPAYPGIDGEYFRPMGQRGQAPSFCLIGDSHAWALAPGMDAVAAAQHQSGLFLDLRMLPMLQEGSQHRDQRLLEWVALNPDIRSVYMVCRWSGKFKIMEGMPSLGDKGRIKPVPPPPAAAKMEETLRRVSRWFVEHGKRVYIFSCIPEYQYDPDDIAARREMIPLNLPIELTRQDYDNRQWPVVRVFETLEKEGLVTLVPLHSAFFAGDEGLVMSPTGSPYYRDATHITPEGAVHAVQMLAPMLWGTNNTDVTRQESAIPK